MKVYTVQYYVPYESDDTLGVYINLQKAQSEVDRLNATINSKWNDTEYHVVERDVIDEV